MNNQVECQGCQWLKEKSLVCNICRRNPLMEDFYQRNPYDMSPDELRGEHRITVYRRIPRKDVKK